MECSLNCIYIDGCIYVDLQPDLSQKAHSLIATWEIQECYKDYILNLDTLIIMISIYIYLLQFHPSGRHVL